MTTDGCRLLRSTDGFTYLTALFMVMVMGVLSAAAGQGWQQRMQREREEELLFRGSQLQDALTRWHYPRGSAHVATPLADLRHLLRDPRTPATVRHLRRLYPDPMTGSDWELIRDPERGIVGVASTSRLQPFKVDNFPEALREFTNKQSYRDWRFVARPPVAVSTGAETAPQPIGTSPRSGPQ